MTYSVSDTSGRGGGKKSGSTNAANTLRSNTRARLLMVLSEGPIKGLVNGAKSIYREQTPIQNADDTFNFENFHFEEHKGYPDDTPFTGDAGAGSIVSVEAQASFNTMVQRTVVEADADALNVIVRLNSLFKVNKDKGTMQVNSVAYAIDVRPAGGSWVTALENHLTNQKTMSPTQIAHRVDLPLNGSPWDVRLRRITPDETQEENQSDIFFESYVILVEGKFTHPHTAALQMEVNAEDIGGNIGTLAFHVEGRLIEVPSNYDPVARTYTGIWDGTFKVAYSNCPPWIFRDLIVNDRFGLGEFVNPASVDKWALYNIARYCDGQVPSGYKDAQGNDIMETRYTFNGVISGREEAFNVLRQMTATWRGMGYWSLGQMTATADMPEDPFCLVSNANVIEGDFNYSSTATKARYSVVLVRFSDPNDFYRDAVEPVINDEMLKRFGWREKTVTLKGCTSRSAAHRYGRWILDVDQHETETVTYRAGLDQLNVVPGRIVSITDARKAEVRMGGRVVSQTATQITLDAPLAMIQGVSYTITWKTPAGTLMSRSVTSAAGAVLTVPTVPAADRAQANAMYALSSTEVNPRQYRVLGVTEVEPEIYQVSALFHDPQKFARVERGLVFDPIPYTKKREKPAAPTNLRVLETGTLSNTSHRSRLTLSWTPPVGVIVRGFMVEITSPDTGREALPITTATQVDHPIVEPGLYSFSVKTVDILGQVSEPVVWQHTVLGDTGYGNSVVSDLALASGGTTFTSTSVRLVWKNKFPTSLAQGATGAAATSEASPLYSHNMVKIMRADTLEVLRSVRVTTPSLTYDFAANKADNQLLGKAPARQLRIEVQAFDVHGAYSPVNTIIVSNPVPAMVSPNVTSAGNVIRVTWTMPDEQDVAGTRVWIETNNTFSPDATTPKFDSTGGVFLFTGTPTTTYYVRVGVYDSFSKSLLNVSAPIMINTGREPLLDTDTPATVTGLALSSVLGLNGKSTLVATWTASTATGLTGYDVELRVSGGNWVSFTTAAIRYEWEVTSGTSYDVRVKARNYAGRAGNYSTIATQVAAANTTPPAVPTGLAITPGFGTLWLKWTANSEPDLAYYEVYESTTTTAPVAGTAATFTSTSANFVRSGLGDEQTRHYWLRAARSTGPTSVVKSAWSARVQATTTASPGVTTEKLAGLVDATSFAANLEPVSIITAASLPTVKTTSTIMWQNKLYRWDGAAYVASVAAVDITGQLTASQIAALEATKITGTLTSAQIAALDAAKLTGTVVEARLASLDAAKLTGSINEARIAALAATKITGTLTSTQIASLDAAKLTGTVVEARLASLDAAKLTGAINEARIAALAASKITGQLTDLQIADLDAAKLSGVIDEARITALDADKLTGIVNEARIVGLAASKVTGTLTSAQIASLDATKLTGTINEARIAALAASKISGTMTSAQIASLDAAKLTGTVVEARLASLDAAKLTGSINEARIAALSAAKITGELTSLQIADLDAAKLTGTIVEARLASLDAAKLTGQINEARIAALSAAKITGELSSDQIAELDAAKLTGTIVEARLASLDAAKLTGTVAAARIAALEASKITGTLSNTQIAALDAAKLTGTVVEARLASLDASKLTGTVNEARIAALAASKITGQVVATQIADAALTAAKFATSVNPVEIFSALPTTGNTAGRMVFLTTDNKLYRYTGTAWTASVASGDIAGTIAAAQLAGIEASKVTGTLTSAQIASLDAAKLSGTVAEARLASLDATKLTGTINEARISGLAASKVTGQLTDAQLSAISAAKMTGQITSTQITDNAVTTAKINAGAVTANEVAANAIVAGKIATNAVTATTIASGAITTAKLAAGAVTANELAAGSVTAGKVAANAITATEIATGTITANELASGSITTVKLAASAVTADQIASNAITAVKISSGAITTAKLAAGAVTANEIGAGAVVAGKVAANAITAGTIAANAVTAGTIAAGAVTADKISATWLQGQNLLIGDTTNFAEGYDPSTKATPEYIASRGENLLTNGSGLLKNNTNFGDSIFYSAEAFSGAGSFLYQGANLTRFSSEIMPVNTDFEYEISLYVKKTAHTAVSRFYAGCVLYDADGLQITPYQALSYPGTQTRLTQPLKPGDTAVYVESVANFWRDGPNNYQRALQIYGYKNSGGYVYPDYTYTRHQFFDAWNVGGIDVAQNKINLRVPLSAAYGNPDHPQGEWPVGHAVSNGGWAGSYIYTAAGNKLTTDEWTRYSGVITGVNNTGAGSEYKFYHGTAGVRLLFLLNREAASAAETLLSNISFAKRQVSPALIDGWTQTGTTFIKGGSIYTGSITANEIAGATITGAKIAANTITAGNIAADTITASQIAANAITASELAANAVTATHIVAGSITGDRLLANTITATQIGAGVITAAEIASATITGAKIAAGTIAASNIVSNSITALQIASNAITADELAANAVTATHIVAGSITGDRLLANTITATQIGAGVITAAEIASATITGAKIAAGTITAGNIAADTITASQIAANAITASELAANAVTATHVLAGSITGDRLTANTITATQIGAGVITAAEIASATITGAKIAAGTITAGNIAADTITASQIAANAVTASELAANAVTATHIVAGTITGDRLVADTITTREVAANAITATQIAAATITGAKIAAGTITAGNIAADTITASQIAANAVTASELAANAVTATHIVAGTITSAQLAAGAITAGKIAAGAIQAGDIAAQAITTDKLLVKGRGQAINPDPGFEDAAQWGATETGYELVAVSDAYVGNKVLRAVNYKERISASPEHRFPIDPTKSFLVELVARKISGTARVYGILRFYTASGALISAGADWASRYLTNHYCFNNVLPGATWTRFAVKIGAGQTGFIIPANAAYCVMGGLWNYTGGASDTMEVGLYRISEAVNGELIVDGSVSANHIVANTITGDKLLANAITAREIASNTVTAAQIAANTITAGQIASGTITATQIATDTITANQIAANAITTSELATNAVTAVNILAGTITGDKLVADTITSREIKAATITAAQIAANTITAGQIASGTITATQIATDTITANQIAANAITTSELATNAVTAVNILAGTITGDKLVADTITSREIKANTITATQIAAGTITAAEIATGTITGNRIAGNTITATQIAATTITANELASNSVTTAKIAAGAVTADQIAANSIVASKLLVSDRNNLLLDGSFEEKNVGNYTLSLGATGSILWSSTAKTGAVAMEIKKTTLTDSVSLVSKPELYTVVEEGEVYYAETEARTVSGTATAGFYARIRWYSNTGTFLSYVDIAGNTGLTTTWKKFFIKTTAPVNAAYAGMQLHNHSTNTVVGSFLVDRIVLRRANAGELIVDGALTANMVGTNELITNSANIKAAVITDAHIANLSAAKLTAGSALAGAITVEGVPLTLVKDRANDPAVRVNQMSTKINPGQILISGSTTLSSWTKGGDETRIDGGQISANTITANKLEIGSRNITLTGIVFDYNSPSTNKVSWTGGTIKYVDDAGVAQSKTITASNATWTSGVLYVYWVKDATTISNTTSQATALGVNNVILATYEGGSKLDADYGRTIIDGGSIKTNTITATQIATNTITATQIAGSTITAAQIAGSTITANQIAASTITANQIAAGTITTAQINTGSFSASGLAVFGNTLKSSNFNGTISNGVITGGTAGWAITAQGNAAFRNLLVSGDLRVGAASTGASLSEFQTPQVKADNHTSSSIYTGAWPTDTFFTLAWDCEYRHQRSVSTQSSKTGNWSHTYYRIRCVPQYRFKIGTTWQSWISLTPSNWSTSQTTYDKFSATEVLLGDYDSCELRIVFQENAQGGSGQVSYNQANVQKVNLVARAIIR